MGNKQIWKNVFDKYQKMGLGQKPSIFAQEVLGYFADKHSLLDLGAGLGQDSRLFSSQGLAVTCTDVSDYALELARDNLSVGNIKFLKVDLASTLPFKNESFDVVYSHLALHYFDAATTRQLFQEIQRVLKPGGILAALFNTIDDPEIKESHFRKIEENYYQEGDGLKKRYFCVRCLSEFTRDLFEIIILDNKGRTYKDEIECLIRFVGKKKY